MKNRLIFEILLCVNTSMFCASMENKKNSDYAQFTLNEKRHIEGFYINGSISSIFNSRRSQDNQDIFLCLNLTENDMLTFQEKFQEFERGRFCNYRFLLKDKLIDVTIAAEGALDKKQYVLIFERRQTG